MTDNSTESRCVGARPLAILVVAYRSPAKLEACLASARRFLPNSPIHVWDNSGPDFFDVRKLADSHLDIQWYLGDTNIGFAAAVNRLAASVPGHDFLLLNPDAELLGSLTSTQSALQHTRVAAAGPLQETVSADRHTRGRLRNRNVEPWDIACRHLTILNAFGSAAGLADRFRGSFVSILYRNQPRIVDGFIAGCCLLINREAWDEIGPFNEEFFLYQEEAEWQRRARNAGWNLHLADEVGFRHQPRGTVSDDDQRLARSRDLAFANAVLMVEFCFGRITAEIYLAFTVAVDEVRRLLFRRSRPSPKMHDVVITACGSNDELNARGAAAIRLADAHHLVGVVALQRLGNLQRDLPAQIKLIRRPWWWPSISPHTGPALLLTGATLREKAFGRIFKLRYPRSVVANIGSVDHFPITNQSEALAPQSRPSKWNW